MALRSVPALAGLVAFAALACGPAAREEDAAEGAEAVVGGRAEAGFPAVGYLVRDGEASCTGTLIEPDVVLTAAHCVEGIGRVAFGWGPVDAHQTTPARAVASHPRYRRPEPSGGLAVQGYDIALLALASRPPIAPMALGPAPSAGAVLGVGYGSTTYERDAAGTYRARGAGRERKSVAGLVTAQGPIEVFAQFDGSGTVCYGDSGGPLIADDKVTGTLSRFATAPSCLPERRATMSYTRVDAVGGFFAAAKACFGATDVTACLREAPRGLCPAPAAGAALPSLVRPTTGDAKAGSFSFDLGEDAVRRLRLPTIAGRTKLDVFSQEDARVTIVRGGRASATDVTEAVLEPGEAIDVLVHACSGTSQLVTLVWAPAE